MIEILFRHSGLRFLLEAYSRDLAFENDADMPDMSRNTTHLFV